MALKLCQSLIFPFQLQKGRALLVQFLLKKFDHGRDCVPTDGWYQLKQKSNKAGDIKKLGFQN